MFQSRSKWRPLFSNLSKFVRSLERLESFWAQWKAHKNWIRLLLVNAKHQGAGFVLLCLFYASRQTERNAQDLEQMSNWFWQLVLVFGGMFVVRKSFLNTRKKIKIWKIHFVYNKTICTPGSKLNSKKSSGISSNYCWVQVNIIQIQSYFKTFCCLCESEWWIFKATNGFDLEYWSRCAFVQNLWNIVSSVVFMPNSICQFAWQADVSLTLKPSSTIFILSNFGTLLIPRTIWASHVPGGKMRLEAPGLDCLWKWATVIRFRLSSSLTRICEVGLLQIDVFLRRQEVIAC